MAQVTLQGTPFALAGSLPAVGDAAPSFRLTGADMQEITLDSSKGRTTIMVVVPSLDTPVCQIETREFNERASALENTEVLIVSADLPFAMKRFCAAEGIENVQACSDVRDRGFGERYGVQLAEGPLEGVTARAVFVLDADNKVQYVELVPEIADQPDYDAVLAAAGGK